jgi:hypothetical protein
MFHAVSLETDIDTAKVLAFSFPELREGLARAQKAEPTLTAVVEADLDRSLESVAFAVSILERSRIVVATTADLLQIADRAKQELRI